MEPIVAALDFLPTELWENAFAFVLSVCSVVSGIGAASGSMTIASVSGYSMFAFYAIHAENMQLLTNVFYATLVLFLIGFAFKLWRLEGTGQ